MVSAAARLLALPFRPQLSGPLRAGVGRPGNAGHLCSSCTALHLHTHLNKHGYCSASVLCVVEACSNVQFVHSALHAFGAEALRRAEQEIEINQGSEVIELDAFLPQLQFWSIVLSIVITTGRAASIQ